MKPTPLVEAAIETALKERWQLTMAEMRYYNDLGMTAAAGVCLDEEVPKVRTEGAGWQTALYVAQEAADFLCGAVDIGNDTPAARALGCVREGLKSALYRRLLVAQRGA